MSDKQLEKRPEALDDEALTGIVRPRERCDLHRELQPCPICALLPKVPWRDKEAT